jgi:hypothetical protein
LDTLDPPREFGLKLMVKMVKMEDLMKTQSFEKEHALLHNRTRAKARIWFGGKALISPRA